MQKSFVLMTAAFALWAAPWAKAEAPRFCTASELARTQRTPMPKKFISLLDFSTTKQRKAAFLIDIDAEGHPTVRCTIEEMSDARLQDEAASAIAKFEYWPADRTSPDVPFFIEISSDAGGMVIPTILPRKSAPLCSEMIKMLPTLEEGQAQEEVKPIFRAPPFYPSGAQQKSQQGSTWVLLTVLPSGAARLDCRAEGSSGGTFDLAAYYAAARYRFAPMERSDMRYYSVRFNYKIEP